MLFGSDLASMEYISRYEDMIQSQDEEMEVCIAHLHPLFERLKSIGKNKILNISRNFSPSKNIHTSMKNMLQERKMSSRILFSEIDVAVQNLENPYTEEEKLMSTDKQFMMVLDTISNLEKKKNVVEESLSFLEFLHLYKTIVNGMMLMHTYTPMQAKGEKSKEDETPFHTSKDLRSITRKRTLEMLRVFETNKTEVEPKKDSTIVSHQPRKKGIDKSFSSLILFIILVGVLFPFLLCENNYISIHAIDIQEIISSKILPSVYSSTYNLNITNTQGAIDPIHEMMVRRKPEIEDKETIFFHDNPLSKNNLQREKILIVAVLMNTSLTQQQYKTQSLAISTFDQEFHEEPKQDRLKKNQFFFSLNDVIQTISLATFSSLIGPIPVQATD